MDDQMPDHDPAPQALTGAEGDANLQPEAAAAPEAQTESEPEPEPEPEPEAAAEPEPDAEAEVQPEPEAARPRDDGGIDRSFSSDLGSDVRDFGQDRPPTMVCQWCGAGLPDPTAETCPSCHGRLKPVQADLEVPGLTALSSEARAIQARVEIARLREAARRGEIVPQAASTTPEPGPAIPPPVLGETEFVAAVQPPDDAVRRLMLEMEIAARRSALERELQPLDPADDTMDDTASGDGADLDGESPAPV